MNKTISDTLLDYRLETQHGQDWRYVTHTIEDAHQPPYTPPRTEVWKTAKTPIGEGGQGQVFRQTCVSGALYYSFRAVKIMPCPGDTGRRRYLRELETMIRFSHEKYSKYFVRILGWYFLDRNMCIAMEYYPEGDLHAYVKKRQKLPEEEAQVIISQVLQGLSMMHKCGFAHRDIKPQNVLIQKLPTSGRPDSWWIKLADFGISKRLDATLTGVSGPVGTLSYMAPELIGLSGDSPNTDYKAADMWAVGVLSFYLLTGLDGFLHRRLSCSNMHDTSMFLPQGCEMSKDILDFILTLTPQHPKERLRAYQAMSHAWLSRFIPKLSTLPSFRNEEQESLTFISSLKPIPSRFPGPSVPESSSSGDHEITTLATNATETSLGSCADIPVQNSVSQNTSKNMSPKASRQEGDSDADIAANLPNMSIHYAASIGYLQVVKILLDRGVDFEALDDFSSNPISIAARGGFTEVARLLCDKGANITTQDPEGYTPLHLAVLEGHLEVVRLLCDRGSDIMRPDRYDRTPLYNAILRGHKEVAKLICNQGVDITKQNNYGETPLLIAAKEGCEELVELLCNNGADITTGDMCRRTPLHHAAAGGHVEVVKLLCDKGADIAKGDKFGTTPLLNAALKGQADVAKLLCDRGADITAAQKDGQTPLYMAAKWNKVKVVKLLCHRGADKLISGDERQRILDEITCMRSVEVVELLCARWGRFPGTKS